MENSKPIKQSDRVREHDKEYKEKQALLLQLKPNISKGFALIKDWEKIKLTKSEKRAYEIYLNGEHSFNNEHILEKYDPDYFISYLRYDIKKVLVRTRQLYIDNNFNENNEIESPSIGFGFYEPLLITLCFAEKVGQYYYSEKTALINVLEDLGEGYALYAKKLRSYFRNGLAHHFRPFGEFFIDLSTEIEYRAPYKLRKEDKDFVKIDVPHLIDSMITYLENYILKLQEQDNNKIILKYIRYLSRRKLITAKLDLEYDMDKLMETDELQDRKEDLFNLFDELGQKRQKRRFKKQLKRIKFYKKKK